ncbi:hypothetical protein [Luedemannella helvata]|uniref:hypothetical protein n=1 Tax=Luedemannella helvata TaxID=349315 RepID=UPI0031D65AD0
MPVSPGFGPADEAAAHEAWASAARSSTVFYPPRPLGVAGWTRTYRTALMVLGGTLAFAVAWSNPDKDTYHSNWLIWTAVAVLLGALSGSAFGSGLARRGEVNRVLRISHWQTMPAIVMFLLLATVAVVSSKFFIGSGLTARGVLLTAIAVVGALPAGATLAALRCLALRGFTGTPGEQLAALIKLRRVLKRVLQLLGSLLVFIVLVNAAAIGWGTANHLDEAAVVYTGAAGTLLVGLMYVPTSALLRRRASIFVSQFVDLAHAPRERLVEAAEDRAKLEHLLGLDHTTLGEIQAGLVIVSPLLASAAAALLPRF